MTDPPTGLDRDELAAWYAAQHLKVDPGLEAVVYLPAGAGDREIRFLEISDLLAGRPGGPAEPIDFGIELGEETEHRLMLLDATPEHWDRFRLGTLPLPAGWSLDGATVWRAAPAGASADVPIKAAA